MQTHMHIRTIGAGGGGEQLSEWQLRSGLRGSEQATRGQLDSAGTLRRTLCSHCALRVRPSPWHDTRRVVRLA